MGRGMWIIAGLIAVMAVAMIWQDSSGGIKRPWTECKESLVQQMFSDQCTPVQGLRGPAESASGEGQPAGQGARQQELGVGEIRRD